MSVQRYTGIDKIISAFQEKAETPYFSLWVKSQCLEQYNGEDMDRATSILQRELEQSKEQGLNEIHILKLHIEKEKVYKSSSPVKCSLYCAVDENKAIYQNGGVMQQQVDHRLYSMIESMVESQKIINSRLLALEEEGDEEEENNLSGIGEVTKLLDHPTVAPIAAIATAYFTKLLSGSTPIALAGVEDQNINDVLNLLFSKGVTITHLNKLAQMPESKIKMLLTML